MLLTGGFMLVEVVGGVLSGSLALLADAGHMLADTVALGLAWLAIRAARKPADERRSYGYQRFQVLAAFVNGGALFLVVAWIGVEAVDRLLEPRPVLGGMMLVVAIIGLLVNLAAFALLHGGGRENINIRAAALHVLGDLLGSVAAIVAALVILWTGWFPIDPLLSVLVAALILRSAWAVVRQSGHILLEGTPSDINSEIVSQVLSETVPGIKDVHHLHAWSLTPEKRIVTLHARVEEGADECAVILGIKAELSAQFQVDHVTVQIERGHCLDEDCLHERKH